MQYILGAMATQKTSSDNLDDILSPGMYYWNYSRPTGATEDTCFMKVYKCKGDIIIQEIYSYTDLSFIRTRKKDGNTFSNWMSRPYFLNSYSDLSSLASALGGVTPGSYEYSGDFNSAPNGTIFVAGTNITNAPITGSLRGYLTTYKPHGSYYAQFYMEAGSNANKGYFTRGYNAGVWSDWQRVYDTSLLTNSALLSPLASALGVNWLSVNTAMRVKYATDFNTSHYPADKGMNVRFDSEGPLGYGFELFFKYSGGLWYRCEGGGGWKKVAETT